VIVAVVVTYITYGAASGWSAGWLAGTALAGNATTIGITAGGVAGFVGGAIISGNIKGAVKGAFAGAVTGGVAGYYGDTYNLARVASESIGGGVSARILGGKFEDGLRFALVVSGLNYANYRMDLAERQSSATNPDNLDKPGSGLYGNEHSIAGARRIVDPHSEVGSYFTCRSPAGGCQGLPIPGTKDQISNLLGVPYKERSMLGYVVDTFAGPHDWFRNHISRSYITISNPSVFHVIGNAKYFTGFRAIIDQVANVALLPLAVPFSAAALISTQPYFYATTQHYLYGDRDG
jgi:hypothetical protein